MSALFLKTLSMSLSASGLVLLVLVLRLVLKKSPKWIHVLLWGMVACRLMVPFTIESPVSVMPKAISSGEIVSEWADDYIGDISMIHDNSVHYDAAVTAGREPISDGSGGFYVVTKYDQLGEPSTVENTVVPILSVIWIGGIVLLGFYSVFSYWSLKKKVDTAISLWSCIYQSEAIGSPFVLGIIHPNIYVPFYLSEQDMDHVIAHEQAHIQRKDHWWKPLGFLLLVIHWFNPLLWLAYLGFCRDLELACDEKVIEPLGNEQRADYVQALLNCSVSYRSVNRRRIAACPLAFGEVGVKDRVRSVMNYKKPTFWILLVSLIVCSVFAVCFLTDPKREIEVSSSMPAMHEIEEYRKEHSEEEVTALLTEVREVLDQTSYEETIAKIEESVRRWEKDQKVFPIDRVELTFAKDPLRMKPLENEMAYDNIQVKVVVFYEENQDAQKDDALTRRLRNQILDVLKSTPYGNYRIGSIITGITNQNHVSLDPFLQSVETFVLDEPVFAVEQDPDLFKIQTAVYDHVWKFSKRIYGEEKTKAGKGLMLKRFGMEDGSEVLTYEIGVYGLPEAVELEQLYKIMRELRDELALLIGEDPDMMAYLDERKISYLEYMFDTPWKLEQENGTMKNRGYYDFYIEDKALPSPLLFGENPYWKVHIQLSSEKIRGQIMCRQDFEIPSEMKVRIVYEGETVGERSFYEHQNGTFNVEFDTLQVFPKFEEMRLDETEFQKMALDLDFEDQIMRIDMERP